MARIAVIGAGVAGSRCAQALAQQGHAVQVVDKARGPGGRLATRRLSLGEQTLSLDHGAPGFAALPGAGPAADFAQGFLALGRAQGWLRDATPRHPDGRHGAPQWRVAAPQPQACKALLGALPLQTSHTLQRLQRGPEGWRLDWAEAEWPAQTGFDAVLLALPPAQAAALLAPVHPAWARAAAATPMQPCWTLMLATDPSPGDWNTLQPARGPLEMLLRHEERLEPPPAGLGLWVAHARPDWSQTHLEAEAETVQAALRTAWAAALQAAGLPVPAVHHAAVHRWRYAQALPAATPPTAWWDAAQGLGVCGDWLGGGGVQGAWTSGSLLAEAIGHG